MILLSPSSFAYFVILGGLKLVLSQAVKLETVPHRVFLKEKQQRASIILTDLFVRSYEWLKEQREKCNEPQLFL
jgi:hypothetical protein